MAGFDLSFLTPIAGLVALTAVVPLIALWHRRQTARRTRGRIGLGEPRRRYYLLPLAALGLTAACFGLAATQPVVSLDETRLVRTDAEAFVAIDTTRSM